jgi:hypothetical protein
MERVLVTTSASQLEVVALLYWNASRYIDHRSIALQNSNAFVRLIVVMIIESTANRRPIRSSRRRLQNICSIESYNTRYFLAFRDDAPSPKLISLKFSHLFVH